MVGSGGLASLGGAKISVARVGWSNSVCFERKVCLKIKGWAVVNLWFI